MKDTLNGKRYDTDKCEVLGEHDLRSYSGNYAGTDRLLRASDGTLLVWRRTNGQDLHLGGDALWLFDYDDNITIDYFDLTDDQEARCAGLGLITLVD